jgi:acetyl esterase/lipase
VTLVPNPRAGDLRESTTADLLPQAYEASAPASVLTGVAYGDDPEQRLDLRFPNEGSAPVILFVHGGGWGAGGRAAVPELVLRFVERGFVVASMDYRGAPEHPFPAAVQDVKRAIRWLKAEAVTTDLFNGEQIVLFGASSGGQLAALVAATPGLFEPDGAGGEADDSSVAGLVSLAGPADFTTMFADPHPWVAEAVESWLACSPCSDAQLAEASPITYVGSDVPPAYWAYGEADPLVPPGQGLAIAERWGGSAGAEKSWFDLVDGQGHNLDHSMINQRLLERFVDGVIGRMGGAS